MRTASRNWDTAMTAMEVTLETVVQFFAQGFEVFVEVCSSGVHPLRQDVDVEHVALPAVASAELRIGIEPFTRRADASEGRQIDLVRAGDLNHVYGLRGAPRSRGEKKAKHQSFHRWAPFVNEPILRQKSHSSNILSQNLNRERNIP